MKILIIILAIIAIVLFFKFRKIPKLGNMILITGGIKTGKSTLSVHLVKRLYRKQLIKYYIKRVFLKLLKILNKRKYKDKSFPEKPLIYSNIPLKCNYVPLTHSLLNRTERFVYGSVCYLCEMSLIADSMSYKDDTLNEQLLLFTKLFAHETKGGYLVIDTQSILDNHYSVKRCLSTYLYVHHSIKTFPFFILMWVKELHFSEDNSIVNTNDGDAEDNLKFILVPKKVWKNFDCYCYSTFTDDLEKVESVVSNVDSLKAENIVSFKKYKTIKVKEYKPNEVEKKT